MMRQTTHHIARGMSRVASSPEIIKSVVGSGYVVACHSAGFEVGGLLHIGHQAHRTCNKQASAHAQATAIQRFLLALEQGGLSPTRANAVIVGGADLLELSPRSLRNSLASARALMIDHVLLESGIGMTQRHLGGTKSRQVVLDLGSHSLTVTDSVAQNRDRLVSARSPSGWYSFGNGRDETTTVDIGCLHVDRGPARLTALLGSCVGVALWEPTSKIGSLAHVMMPHCPEGNLQKAKFADTVVPALLEAMSRAGVNGGAVEAKLAGGSRSMFSPEHEGVGQVGKNNLQVVRRELEKARIPVVGEDVGGGIGRKMSVDLDTFRVRVKMLSRRGEV